jgi:hypothetical protein
MKSALGINEKSPLKGRTLLFKFRLTLFFIIILFSKVDAQFNFQRITPCFGMTILNEKGEEISFNKDSTYTVKIDGVVYRSPKAPILIVKDSIRMEPNTEINFSWHVRNYNPPEICSFRINNLTPPIYEGKNAELEIIHGSDTLFLTTGNYTYELKFNPGHYYFPSWIREIYEQKPKASKNIQFRNLDQRNFLVSKTDYDQISKSTDLNWLDDQIADRFIEGYYTVDKHIDSIQFNQTFDHYQLQGFHRIYPTKNKDIYVGFIRCIPKTTQQYNFIPCVLNNKENSITLKPHRNDLEAYKFHWIFSDTLNQTYYQVLSSREPSDSADFSKYRTGNVWKPLVLKSIDEGGSWMKDTLLTSLIEKNVRYHLSLHDKTHSAVSSQVDHYLNKQHLQLSFLDKSHAIVSFDLYTSFNKSNVKQGIYYLLKNGQVIDSCISQQLGFSDYVSRNHFLFSKDTMVVGAWYVRTGHETPDSSFTLVIGRNKNQWKFHTISNAKRYDRKEEIKQEPKYLNFKINGKNTLYFEDGSSLSMLDEITSTPDWYRSLALENGNQIYLLNKSSGTTWISFDKGKSWYFYPKMIDELRSEYDIIETENGVISIFNATKLTKTRLSFRELSK